MWLQEISAWLCLGPAGILFSGALYCFLQGSLSTVGRPHSCIWLKKCHCGSFWQNSSPIPDQNLCDLAIPWGGLQPMQNICLFAVGLPLTRPSVRRERKYYDDRGGMPNATRCDRFARMPPSHPIPCPIHPLPIAVYHAWRPHGMSHRKWRETKQQLIRFDGVT